MRLSVFKKLLAVVILVVLVASEMPILPAQAQIPVTDLAHIGNTIVGVAENSVTAAEQTIDTVQVLYEWVQKFVLQILKNKLVSKLQDVIIGYTQGGGGAAKFVVNWQSYLGDARINVAQNFSKSLSASDSCSTFKTQLLTTMGGSGNKTGGGGGDDNFKCDFSKTQLSSFNKDFKQGGWTMYKKTMEPQNNYAGALLMAREKQQAAILDAEKAAQNEAIAGGGFLSGKSADGIISNPGSLIKDITANAADADFKLITSADSIQGLAAIAATALSKELSKSGKDGDGGVSGVNLRARKKKRNEDDAKERNPDGTHRALTRSEVEAQCLELYPKVFLKDPETGAETTELDPEFDDTDLRKSCMEGGVAETANGQGRKAQLLRNIGSFIQIRKAAKLAIGGTITLIGKQLNAFDKNNDDIVDDSYHCTADKQGAATKSGEKVGTPGVNGDTTKFDGISTRVVKGKTVSYIQPPSSVTTGRIFHPSTGKTSACAIQTASERSSDPALAATQKAPVFEDLLPSRNELLSLRTQNLTAMEKLADFQKRARAVSEKDDEAIAELNDELNLGAEHWIFFGTTLNTPTDFKETFSVFACSEIPATDTDPSVPAQIFSTDQSDRTCDEYVFANGLMTANSSVNPVRFIYRCGGQALSNPWYNQECTDYTLGRANNELELQTGINVEDDATGCTPNTDPEVNDPTNTKYDPDACIAE